MKKQTGFSLVELLVTATIIALLAAVGMVSYTTANRNSRNAKRATDLEQVRAALELYRTEEGCYPSQGSCTTADDFETLIDLLSDQSNQYISNPDSIADPKNNEIFYYSYTFGSGNGCTVYQLCATKETAAGNEPYCVCNP